MKSVLFYTFLLISSVMFSCQPVEEEVIETDTPIISQAEPDSLKEHNLVWNNRYYQLEFKEAYGQFTHYIYDLRSTQGTGPSSLTFVSKYIDTYSGISFTIFVCIGWVTWSEINHEVYIPNEAKNELNKAEIYLALPYAGYETAGTCVMVGTDDYLLKNQNNLSMEVSNFHTYMQDGIGWAEFDWTITSDQIKLHLPGKLSSQGN